MPDPIPASLDPDAARRSAMRIARRVAWRWSGLYVLAAGVWVAAGSLMADTLAPVELTGARLAFALGLLLVLPTSAGLYLIVHRTASRLARHVSSIREQHRVAVETEGRWRHLMSNLSEVAWFTSWDGRSVLYMSPASFKVYGRGPEEFIRDPRLWLELVHPADRSMVELATLNLVAEGSRSIEYRIRHADGSWRWLRDRASVLRDAQGEAIGVGGVAEDITEWRATTRALKDREQRLAGVIESAMDAIITIDADQRIRVFNRAAGRIFGIDPSRAIGGHLERFIPQRLRAAHDGHVAAFAEAGATSRPMGSVHRLSGLRADGSEFPIEASISRHDAGDEVQMTVVLRDVTEARAAEAAREAQRSAEAASRAKSEFLSRMSHELRTPLNAVLGFAQLLQSSNEPLGARQQAQVEHIRTAGWHLLALINDVLDVSRIESGTLKVKLAALDVREPVAESLRLSESLARQHGVRIEGPHTGAGAWRVRADLTRLRQVLLNILSNAIKYNRPGGRVALSLRVQAQHVCIEIEDNGLGMTPEQLDCLYQPFNRLGRERGGIEGTGIGLTLTRELVLLMGGQIEISSQAGQGTVVRIEMPVDGVTDDDADARRSAPMPLPPAAQPSEDPARPAGLVLYVEDNPVNMLVVEQLLARWPRVQLIQAEDGATGIELAVRLKPDLMLLDMRLPDMDGLKVLRRLRADVRTADLPVVALSASAMAEEISAAQEAGALEYWTKPLDFRRFLDDIARLLQPALLPAHRSPRVR